AQAGNASFGGDHFVPFIFEVVPQPSHHLGLIFNDQNFCHAASSGRAARKTCPLQVNSQQDQAGIPPGARGRAIVKVLPWPGVLSTATSPPWAWTMCRTRESPSPLPFVLCTSGSPTR